MKNIGNFSKKCQCCNASKINAPFYEWVSHVTGDILGIICRKCAVREMFGTKYKYNKKYQRWIKEENERRKM